MKKVLIIGATGDLGSYFLDYCTNSVKSEYEFIAVGRRNTDFYLKNGIEYHQVDISKKTDVSLLPNNDIYAIVNFAAAMPAHMIGYDPYKYFEINTIGTLNLLEFARQHSVKKFLFMQTIRDIGEYFKDGIVLTSNLPRKFNYNNDHTVYTISKNAAVDLLENYHQQCGLNTYVFRLPNIYMYTPQKTYNVDGIPQVIAYRKFIDLACAGEDIEMWGDPNIGKDIVYVKDFCQMVYKALISNLSKGTFNVGSGMTTTLKEQIDGIIEVFCTNDKKSKVIHYPNKTNARSYRIGIQDAMEKLGYEPIYNYKKYLHDYKKEMEAKRFDQLYE